MIDIIDAFHSRGTDSSVWTKPHHLPSKQIEYKIHLLITNHVLVSIQFIIKLGSVFKWLYMNIFLFYYINTLKLWRTVRIYRSCCPVHFADVFIEFTQFLFLIVFKNVRNLEKNYFQHFFFFCPWVCLSVCLSVFRYQLKYEKS